MLVLLLAGCSVWGAAPANESVGVTAARLDGAKFSGELIGWTDREAIINTSDGEQRVATDQLVALRWSNRQATRAEDTQSPCLVELTDGTILPATEFGVRVGDATVTLDPSLASNEKKTLSVPAPQVAAVRLRTLEPETAAQWNEIRSQGLASDVLVVLKRDGKSLDYVEGVLGDVTPEKIEFKLEGEPLRVDRSKVAGLVYFRNPKNQTDAQCILHGTSGLQATAVRTRLANGVLHITTAAGVAFNWPLSDIHLADFSAGKIVYLSDIEPASMNWTPLIGLPAGAELAANFGRPRLDQSAFGGPLSLYFRDADSNSLGQPRTFEKGLALRSRTELVYRLPADYRRFVAVAGIEPATSAAGKVRLLIQADDEPLVESDIDGSQPPKEIDVDVTGVRRLKIVVDFGDNLDTGDWVNLCEARLIK